MYILPPILISTWTRGVAGKAQNALHRHPVCRKLLQTSTPISSHKASPPVAINHLRPTTRRHGPLTFPGPRNVARTWARTSTFSLLLTHGGATTGDATRCPDEQPNPNLTRPRAQQPNPSSSHGWSNQLPYDIGVFKEKIPLGLKGRYHANVFLRPKG